ncbi:MAG: helix-turn-helix transcriptional regulator, partial [Lentisphaeria bacterium]|nr:helix-turn-helix transcriptional regulator [Lentisphaeria bacterium]
ASWHILSEINRTCGYFFPIGEKSSLEERLFSYRKYAGATFSQSPLEAASMVFGLLNDLCRPSEGELGLPRKNRQVRDLQSEIQNAFNESLSATTLARRLGITREHLSKTFRAKTGRTFQDYREEQRLNEALTLLLKSNLSCKEVAVLCHYNSYSSFFRSFKKHFHVSPEAFRERQQ